VVNIPKHVSEPLEPPPAPPVQDPNAPSPTVVAEGTLLAGGPQSGETLTTSTGVRLYDSDHSLKAGRRGPALLEDHHLREKITHFDHERIPERVVHARGTGAHGVFASYGTAQRWTRAAFLAKGAADTPVFVRFSTVLGSRGSADTVRDTRGFATKFYTPEGNFDLVGNNIPVFFIQDGIKFPDVIHAAKPHPDLEIPQAQSAHDTFWDFVSLHTEATHHVFWAMSDRAIPRSFRTMQGFGVHTFRLAAADDRTSLVKFHWRPTAGVHSLIWEEALITAGVDPDFHRRDLAEAIASGRYPQWELGLQVMPDTPEQAFEGIDLLDPTKIVPEELCPVVPVGMLTLTRNPANFFAETEQVAFHTGHLVPGIEPTADPLLQVRMFSYLDTQISRLGGPNFTQLPVNRPIAEVNDNLRDGMHQTQVHTGVAPYTPNSLGGGCPFPADVRSAYVETPYEIAGPRIRGNPTSFEDHFTQPAMFYRSLTDVEQQHIVEAFAFELGKCHEQAVRARMLEVLARVDSSLCGSVATLLGLPAPQQAEVGAVLLSPALRQVVPEPSPAAGRVVGVVVPAATQVPELGPVVALAEANGVTVRLIAPTGAAVPVDGQARPPDRTYSTVRSVELDAVVLAGTTAGADPRVATLVAEAYRHCKPLVLLGGVAMADPAMAPLHDAAGVVLADDPKDVEILFELLGRHRVWEREPNSTEVM
jgi:catalase